MLKNNGDRNFLKLEESFESFPHPNLEKERDLEGLTSCGV